MPHSMGVYGTRHSDSFFEAFSIPVLLNCFRRAHITYCIVLDYSCMKSDSDIEVAVSPQTFTYTNPYDIGCENQ